MGIKILIKMLEFMPESVTKKIASRYVRGILHKYANVSVEGYENIKDLKGPILFICNHLSNADGLILNEVLKNEYPELAKKVQLHIPDENSRRVGQSVAAASLPKIK